MKGKEEENVNKICKKNLIFDYAQIVVFNSVKHDTLKYKWKRAHPYCGKCHSRSLHSWQNMSQLFCYTSQAMKLFYVRNILTIRQTCKSESNKESSGSWKNELTTKLSKNKGSPLKWTPVNPFKEVFLTWNTWHYCTHH